MLHLSVESAALFELLAGTPHQNAATALPRVSPLLKRISRSMQRLRTSLPDTNSGVLLTATDEAACLSACEEARSLNTELLAMSAPLSEGEASHLQPLLAKLEQLANASSSAPQEGEDEPAAAEAKASDGSQPIEPFARPLLDAVEHTTVQLLLAVQNLRQQSLQPPNTAASESAVKEEDDEEDGGGTEQGSVLKHHEWLCKLLSAARGDQITSSLTSVIQSLLTLADGPTSPALREMAAKVVSELVRLTLHLSSLRWAVHQSMSFHGSPVRLELVLLNLSELRRASARRGRRRAVRAVRVVR